MWVWLAIIRSHAIMRMNGAASPRRLFGMVWDVNISPILGLMRNSGIAMVKVNPPVRAAWSIVGGLVWWIAFTSERTLVVMIDGFGFRAVILGLRRSLLGCIGRARWSMRTAMLVTTV